MIEHIVVACLEHTEVTAVASGLIAVEHGLKRLGLVPTPIDEGAVSLALVLQILFKESVKHPLARQVIERGLCIHFHEMPYHLHAQRRLFSVERTGHTEVRLLPQVIFIVALIHRIQVPRGLVGALHQQVVLGVEVFSRIDVSKGHRAIVERDDSPLLRRHVGLRPHHHGCLVGL